MISVTHMTDSHMIKSHMIDIHMTGMHMIEKHMNVQTHMIDYHMTGRHMIENHMNAIDTIVIGMNHMTLDMHMVTNQTHIGTPLRLLNLTKHHHMTLEIHMDNKLILPIHNHLSIGLSWMYPKHAGIVRRIFSFLRINFALPSAQFI